jgi:uncharacterized membrane protein
MKRYILLVIGLGSSCSLLQKPSSEAEQYFLTEVKPVLQQHCLRCHNGALPAPALNLTSRETAFAKSASGRDFIVPGAPDRSLLVGAIGRKGTHPKMMPRTDLSLTDDQIGMLREWIEDGAHWPAGEAGRLQAVATTEIP